MNCPLQRNLTSYYFDSYIKLLLFERIIIEYLRQTNKATNLMVLMGLASSMRFCFVRKGMPKVFSTCSRSLSLKFLLCDFFPSLTPVGLHSSKLTELFLGLGGGTVSGDQAMLLLGAMLMSVSLSTP